MTSHVRNHMTFRRPTQLLLLLLALGATGCGLSTTAQTPRTLPTPTPAQPVVLSDALATNTNGWTDDSRTCFFQSDGYHVTNGHPCFAPTAPLGDEMVSVQAKATAGTDYVYGVQLRQQPTVTLNCYAFLVETTGEWAIFKTVDDQDTPLVNFTPNAAIKKGMGATNTLEARATAGRLEFLVNGSRLGSVDDATFAQGFTGLTGDSGGEVVYSNLLITGPGGATKAPPPGSVKLQDALTGDMGNLPPSGGAFMADGYHITDSTVEPYAYRDFSDANIQVTVRHLQGSTTDGYGIAFRHQDGGNAYLFVISYDGNAGFLKLANHIPAVIQSFAPKFTIRTGLHAANTLQIQATGTHFTFYINGAKVGEADDSTYASGKPGLVSVGGETVFSDFYLSQGN